MVVEKLDPVKFEVLYNKLDQILDEGKELMRYLSGSTITREAGEVVQAYYTLDGEAADIACGILIHILSITRCIQYANRNRYDAPGIGIYEGDMFINNDPYIGGAHVPDTGIIAPIFYKGRQLGWTAALSHSSEVGGIEPGASSRLATCAWHEGLHLPLVKLVEKGTMRRDVLNMILRGTRDPWGVELDIRARIAGCERVKRRLAELIEEFGEDFFIAATQQMVKQSEIEARQKIKQLKPGIYSTRVFNDTIGISGDKPAIYHLDLEVTEEGDIVMNLPVVSPQCDGSNNCYLPGSESNIFFVLLEKLFYNMRWSTGLVKTVKFNPPLHSRLAADQDRAVGFGVTGTALTFTNAITNSLSQALYVSGNIEEVEASPDQTAVSPSIAGFDRLKKYRVNVANSISTYGSGGRIGKDGIDSGIQNFNPWNYASDTEGEEMLLPILRLAENHAPDTGGYGKYRGGTGLMDIFLFHKGEEITIQGLGCGSYIPLGQGLWGGYPPGRTYTELYLDTDIYQRIEQENPLPHLLDEVDKYVKGRHFKQGVSYPATPVKSGDLVVHLGRGGCALGDPIEREPALIVKDIENNLASFNVCERVYCVSIDPETLDVDYEKTNVMRLERRKQRLSQGTPAQNYLKELVAKRKKRELPQIALNFLDETIAFSAAYREQLEEEERLSLQVFKPLENIKVKREILNLTLYVKIVEDEQGRIVNVCNNCGFAYCNAQENYKLYSLVYERNPEDVHPIHLAYPADWCIYREFYCPGCGTQTNVEATVPGTPILHDVKLKLHK